MRNRIVGQVGVLALLLGCIFTGACDGGIDHRLVPYDVNFGEDVSLGFNWDAGMSGTCNMIHSRWVFIFLVVRGPLTVPYAPITVSVDADDILLLYSGYAEDDLFGDPALVLPVWDGPVEINANASGVGYLSLSVDPIKGTDGTGPDFLNIPAGTTVFRTVSMDPTVLGGKGITIDIEFVCNAS